jgi:hypothetical protein
MELLQVGSSDAQGRFSLQAQLDADDRRIDDRMTLIIAKAPKHGFGGMRYGSDTKNVEVTLSEETPIEGRLLMPNGSPAKGVQVRLLSARQSPSIMEVEGWRITSAVWRQGKEYKISDFPEPVSTDDNGRFTLGGLAQGGEAEIEIRDDRFALEELCCYGPRHLLELSKRHGWKAPEERMNGFASLFLGAPLKPAKKKELTNLDCGRMAQQLLSLPEAQVC